MPLSRSSTLYDLDLTTPAARCGLGAKEGSDDARSTDALRCALTFFARARQDGWRHGSQRKEAIRQRLLRACENLRICESVKAICTLCREHSGTGTRRRSEPKSGQGVSSRRDRWNVTRS
jgi:hypothetical protein